LITQTPQPQAPAGPPSASSLEIKREAEGTGTPAKPGDRVTVHFVIRNMEGAVLADSERRGLSYTFVAGTSKIPRVLAEGVLGMKVGETRVVSAQPDALYGNAGSPPFVPGATPLQAVIRMLRIQP
ncbi:MAG TPA: FKBP-type peptidyl-prolyl cis-trans isomerase, partial [Fimbriimonadaceae bacterium]|nr:FKBP-type peptidyl-prolyl cis-trans isomerase [Fimbriimonadaceae bacterium]